MEEFWGYDSNSSSRSVDVCIAEIRKKIAVVIEFEILTVHGLGYMVFIDEYKNGIFRLGFFYFIYYCCRYYHLCRFTLLGIGINSKYWDCFIGHVSYYCVAFGGLYRY